MQSGTSVIVIGSCNDGVYHLLKYRALAGVSMLLTSTNLEDEEKKAEAALQSSLESHIPLLRRTYNLVQTVLQMAISDQVVSPPKKACLNLLARLPYEIAALSLLLAKGYSVQAVSIGASIFELSWTVAYIGDDVNISRDWQNHRSTKQFKKIKNIILRGALKRLRLLSNDRLEAEYKNYQLLCLGKHLNPMFQIVEGVDETPELLSFDTGPKSSPLHVLLSWWLISTAIEPLYPSIRAFVECHVSSSVHQEAIYNELKASDGRSALSISCRPFRQPSKFTCHLSWSQLKC